jgi:hypothetical protein
MSVSNLSSVGRGNTFWIVEETYLFVKLTIVLLHTKEMSRKPGQICLRKTGVILAEFQVVVALLS